MALETAPRYYEAQQRLTALAVRQVGREATLAAALRLLALYQTTGAGLAVRFGDLALREQGADTKGERVQPAAFTVTPSEPSVLEEARTPFEFNRIVATLVADAGRSAMGAYTASRTRSGYGHMRQLTPPSCERCAILAGRWYRWSDAFKRHPQCDCVMVPALEGETLWDPYGAYERGEIGSYRTMPDGTRRFEQGLTKAQRAAVDDGADIAQVVNAQRGMQTVNFAGRKIRVTTEGTTSRGLAFRELSTRGTARVDSGFATRITRRGPEERLVTREVARAPRLSPEAIYKVAADRDDAIRLLGINGYLV